MQGSFVRKRGSTWTAYFYVPGLGGQRRQRSKGGFRTKVEAQHYLNEAIHSIQAGEYVEKDKRTLADYLEKQWLPLMENVVRPATFDSYQRMLKLHVVSAIGSIELQELTAEHLDRLYAHLLKDGRHDGDGGLAPKTVRYIHNTLSKALKDAERKGLVVRNVASRADPPKLRQSGSKEMKIWSPDQLRVFLTAMEGHRIEAAYVLAATTGMRRGEVLGLRWGDIDFEKRRLAVRQTVLCINYKISLGTPKTARGRRSIAVDEATLAALKAHGTRQRAEKAELGRGYTDQDLIFAKVDGSPINPDYFSQVFDRTVAKLDIPRIRLHDLRHTHATIGLAAGVPPKVMSDRLGHATVAFTQDTYMHAIPRLEEEAADQMAALIFGGGDQ